MDVESLLLDEEIIWIIKRNSNGLPSYMYYLYNGSADSKIICDLFADYFVRFSKLMLSVRSNSRYLLLKS